MYLRIIVVTTKAVHKYHRQQSAMMSHLFPLWYSWY